MVVPHAYFGHPDIAWINRHAFGTGRGRQMLLSGSMRLQTI